MVGIMLKNIVKRIEDRLSDLGKNPTNASLEAGLSDSAIRNWQRTVKKGGDTGFNSKSIAALAPVLETTIEWLVEGKGAKEVTPAGSIDQNSSFEAIAARLTGFRKAFGVSGKQFAQQHGFDPEEYETWESGEGRITIDAALYLNKSLQLSISYIYTGE